MNNVTEIENAIGQLNRDDLSRLRTWFETFDARAWDDQFAEDVAAGRLDSLAEEALKDLREGRCREL